MLLVAGVIALFHCALYKKAQIAGLVYFMGIVAIQADGTGVAALTLFFLFFELLYGLIP